MGSDERAAISSSTKSYAKIYAAQYLTPVERT